MLLNNCMTFLYDILCEYDNVRTAKQLANRIYDAFTAIEQ